MSILVPLPFVGAALGLVLAAASLLRRQASPATWCFVAGMTVLSVESIFAGFSLRATDLPDVLRWLTLQFAAASFAPVAWLAFSLTYSRGDYRESLRRWRAPLAAFAALPIGLSLLFRDQVLRVVQVGPDGATWALRFGVVGTALNAIVLVAYVLVLTNLEQTLRAAVGTMRWRIKLVVLGLAVLFGARLYAAANAILYSVHDVSLSAIESSGLLVGELFLVVGYARTRFSESEVYPSRAVLRSSLTVLIAGSYLFVVGILAQVVKRFGGAESFQIQSLLVLVGMGGLAALLFSDRARQRVNAFVGRHFRQAQHDSVRVWTELSQRLADTKDNSTVAASAARLVSETFEVLSVTVWLLDEEKDELVVAASTGRDAVPGLGAAASPQGLRDRSLPFDLEPLVGVWAEAFRAVNPVGFPNGGHRWCVPLRTGDGCLGVLVLADRVSGVAYTIEERELLQCVGDQVTSVLLNLKLGDELARAKELEAFRTMSTFFVHDLKNAAASLNLMLKNLPVHFDDPQFRQDALRGIGNTARRIDEMIARLGALKQRPELRPTLTDLNALVGEAIDGLGALPGAEVTRDLQPLPEVQVDPGQLHSVLTNLLLNARDAVCGERAGSQASRTIEAAGGRVHVRTERRGRCAQISVIDNGCGMSPSFVRDSLFRPFQTTKKKGLGIGMFQARMIVEAHGGHIQVESEAGKGTTVQVSLPLEEGR